MNELLRRRFLTVPFAIALTSAVHAGEIIVDRSGAGDTVDISSALALAQDGDLILVRPGAYAENLLIDGLSVSIVAQHEGSATVEGRLVIRSLSSTQPVLLHGLRFEGVTDPLLDAQRSTLDAEGLAGELTVARCVFVGAPAADSTQAFEPVGGAGAHLDGVLRFSARASVFQGGDGVDELSCTDGDGGDGLQLESSRAALWGCAPRGPGCSSRGAARPEAPGARTATSSRSRVGTEETAPPRTPSRGSSSWTRPPRGAQAVAHSRARRAPAACPSRAPDSSGPCPAPRRITRHRSSFEPRASTPSRSAGHPARSRGSTWSPRPPSSSTSRALPGRRPA